MLALTAALGFGMTAARVEAQQRTQPPSRAAVQYSFAPIVKRAAPAVVNVYVRSRVRTFVSPFAGDPFFDRFFSQRFGRQMDRVQNSLGSGVIVAPEGIVVTNTHVVKTSGASEIRVVLSDKREFDAKVILQDEKTDIAVLRIEGGEGRFPYLQFDDSDGLEVGDLVLAIGNPFGVGQTVTSGIVSALSRSEVSRSDAQVFIQTDAAINPGNSGGALVDMQGQLVGINTAIFSKSGGSHGIGFAIPSNLVRLYVESAITGRKIERPWLGAHLEAVTRDVAEALGLNRSAGAVVSRIAKGGPAAAAGLAAGDVIIAVDGTEVDDARATLYRLTTVGVGKRVRLDVLRDGRPVVLTLSLRAAPPLGRNDVRDLTGNHPFDGVRAANLVPAIIDEIGIDEDSGVVIVSVADGSVASRLGFKKGDIIVQIGNAAVGDVVELERLVSRRQAVWLLAIKRDGRTVQLRVAG